MALRGSNTQENPADRGNRGKLVKNSKGKFREDNLARTNTKLARNCNYVAIRLQSESNAESNAESNTKLSVGLR